MTRLALAAVLALALGGCVTASRPALTVSVPLPPPRPATRADAAIARASAELARYCGLTQAALAAIEFFATSDKVRAAADYAEAVVDEVCASPPSDVRTALDSVGRAYSAVVEAGR